MADVRGYSQAVLPQFQGRDLANDINIGQQKVAQQRLLQKEEYDDYLSTIEMPESVPTSYQPLFRPIIRDLIGVKSEAWKAKESGDNQKYNELERKAGNIQSQLLDLADVSKEAYAISGKNLDVLKSNRDIYDPEEFAKREAKVAFGLDPTRADVSITTNQDGDLVIGESSAFEVLRSNIIMPPVEITDWRTKLADKAQSGVNAFKSVAPDGSVSVDISRAKRFIDSEINSGTKLGDDILISSIAEHLGKNESQISKYDVNQYMENPEVRAIAENQWVDFVENQIATRGPDEKDGDEGGALGNVPAIAISPISDQKGAVTIAGINIRSANPDKGMVYITGIRNANGAIQYKGYDVNQSELSEIMQLQKEYGEELPQDAIFRILDREQAFDWMDADAQDVSNINAQIGKRAKKVYNTDMLKQLIEEVNPTQSQTPSTPIVQQNSNTQGPPAPQNQEVKNPFEQQ